MQHSYELLVWYEFRELPVRYDMLNEHTVEPMIQRIREMNNEPGLNNRAIRFEVEYVRREQVEVGVF